MTTLRDDGYLETDDPVVMGCFWRKKVRGAIAIHVELHHSDEFVLADMRDLGWTKGVGDGNGNWWDYPIRIPAATVAEVYGQGMQSVPVGPIEAVLFQATDGLRPWLRKHTEIQKR